MKLFQVMMFSSLWLFVGCTIQVQPIVVKDLPIFQEKEPDRSPILLPDGDEFDFWERPMIFSKTYHVDNRHPYASDENPGTEDQPFKTINHAAQILQSGERVIVHEGIYRERVIPKRGGDSPEMMISYEVAKDERVVLRGSRVFRQLWKAKEAPVTGKKVLVWTASLASESFDSDNPFKKINLPEEQIDTYMPWAVWQKENPGLKLKRGLVFQNGQRLTQVSNPDELSRMAGTYYIEPDGSQIHMHPFYSLNPNHQEIEITERDHIFAPEKFQLGYIRVKGFVIERAANGFPLPQEGALSVRGGHHWIIENNTIRQCNSLAMDIGGQYFNEHSRLAQGGQHVVRGNTIYDCGISGIQGYGVCFTLLENNSISNIGWHRVEGTFETGGIKLHRTVNTVVRNNKVFDTIDAAGIWMDYAIVNSRVTRNLIYNISTIFHGGIFMEASQKPNLVDHNVIWGVHGKQGVGIYQHDCDDLIIAHNLIGGCKDEAIKMRANEDRKVLGRMATCLQNNIFNNVFVDNGGVLYIPYQSNSSDYNVIGLPPKGFMLDQWQAAHGWDQNSSIVKMKVKFDEPAQKLTFSTSEKMPQVPRYDLLLSDYWHNPRENALTNAGPFESKFRKIHFNLAKRWKTDSATIVTEILDKF